MGDVEPAKVYSYGKIGRGYEIQKAFDTYGAKNPMGFKFNDPGSIYYIDKNNNIARTNKDTDLYYVITNSDWLEIALKESKKTREFLLTITEGSSKCDGCSIKSKCNENNSMKCEISRCISKLLEINPLSGKSLIIKEITPTNVA